MTESGRAACIAIAGRPGSGKTTLAPKLAEALRVPLISRDRIKEGRLVTLAQEHEVLPPDTNRLVSHCFAATVRGLLKAGVSVVAEAAFQHHGWQAPMASFRSLATVRLLLCVVPTALATERMRERVIRDPAHSWFHGAGHPRADWTEPAFEVPTLRVDTSDGYRPGFEALVAFGRGDPA